MDEPLEPIRPQPTTPAYLPRLWKSPPEPEEEVAPSKKKKLAEEAEARTASAKPKAKKKKKVEPAIDDGTGATKLKETPVLDTYEARQRARWIISGLLTAIGAIALIIILQAFRGSGEEEIREGEPPSLVIANVARPNLELEARNVLNNAKLSDRNGKSQVALDLLNKLVKNYHGTAAVREALHAIDRNRQSLPLFDNNNPNLASRSKGTGTGLATPTGPSPPTKPSPAAAPSVATAGPTTPSPASSTPTLTRPTSPQPIAPPTITPSVALKSLPRGFQPKADTAVHPSGWPTRILCERDGAEMVLVPGGTFLMGREDGDPEEAPGAPRGPLDLLY